MNIQFSFQGMDPSDALREYTSEKFGKYEELLVNATSVVVDFKDNISARGVKNDFKMSIHITLPKAHLQVDEVGAEMYAVVDKALDTLGRRLKRYHDRKGHWEGTNPWEVTESDESIDEPDNYVNYVPKISKRTVMDNLVPMGEGEAIERMELLGQAQILFKNSGTGKISMIYKDQGSYVLVEPDTTL